MHPCMLHLLDMYQKGLDIVGLYDGDHIIVEHRTVLARRVVYWWSDQDGYTGKPNERFIPLSWYGLPLLIKSFSKLTDDQKILLKMYVDSPHSFR